MKRFRVWVVLQDNGGGHHVFHPAGSTTKGVEGAFVFSRAYRESMPPARNGR